MSKRCSEVNLLHGLDCLLWTGRPANYEVNAATNWRFFYATSRQVVQFAWRLRSPEGSWLFSTCFPSCPAPHDFTFSLGAFEPAPASVVPFWVLCCEHSSQETYKTSGHVRVFRIAAIYSERLLSLFKFSPNTVACKHTRALF